MCLFIYPLAKVRAQYINGVIIFVVPTPTIIIEEVGVPLLGFEYTLSCIVTVDDSVDTNITIVTEWRLPAAEIPGIVQTIDDLRQAHNLTFQSLQLQHEGNYTCTAVVYSILPVVDKIFSDDADQTIELAVDSE